jgi:iron complex transport system substrate-binding protein
MKPLFAPSIGALALITLAVGLAPMLAQAACPADAAEAFAQTGTVEFAQGFAIEYFETHKLVTVTAPWPGAEEQFQYVLVPCSTPAERLPDDLPPDAPVITVPVDRVIAMSTTYLPALAELGVLDRVVALDETDFAYTPAVRDRIRAGDIVEVGSGAMVDIEAVLALEPGLIMTYGSGFADYDAHPILLEAGLPVVLNGEFAEPTALGRAEWVRFIAAFFNREAEADALFMQIRDEYQALASLTADVAERPTVLANAMYGGVWYMAGGASTTAQFIADAGGDYLWADDTSTGSLSLSFEDVLDRAQDADIWINANTWLTLADGLAEDERYAEFRAFAAGQVFNPILRIGPMGGNDFYEAATLHPETVLADLIHIFHPDLLPDHEPVYFQQLQ